MELSLHANVCDLATQDICHALRDPFRSVGSEVRNDYGGTMRRLWIDFELVESYADRREPLPFRFQRRVGGSVSKLTGLQTPAYENVGHYSVRPDFATLLTVRLDVVASYALGVIYGSTTVLIGRRKRLGGFDADRFREDFRSACAHRGFAIAADQETA